MIERLDSVAVRHVNALHAGKHMQATGQNIHKNVHKCSKMPILNILRFLDHIWNHHEKSIQKSTNMPGIGSLIREIDVNIF